MATTTSSSFPLATLDPYTGGDGSTAGTANAGSNGTPDDDAGASGASGGKTFDMSTGALVAIIVIVVIVALLGIASATIFYLAKKREWKVRETIRRSAKKVVMALTPRRTEFPRSVKEGSIKSRSGRVRMTDVPPTPRLKPEDLEKGIAVKVDVKHKYFHRK
ncbi:hypothetical protein VPNG_06701 [Cytospora leucostoma]|uniref:Uncharacterized protein n=1 Tax=Cytospora leucostoma TaxID=1230097 RepID=A0A423WSW7_9PEZI|nr:hypothetical protein VPNG_06701 [Cytospora leucostoma]